MRLPVLLVASWVLFSGCPKKEEPKKEHAAAPVAPNAQGGAAKVKTAECEFFGTLAPGKVKAAKTVFVVMKEPCSPLPAEIHLYGQAEFQEKLFAEFYVPQGSQGHLCIFGLDESGKIVGWAAYAKNPVSMAGEGEVIFDHIDLTLEPLAAPVAAPKGM